MEHVQNSPLLSQASEGCAQQFQYTDSLNPNSLSYMELDDNQYKQAPVSCLLK